MLGLIVWELGTFSARVFATIPPTALRRDSSISKFFRERPSVDRVLSGMGLYDDREAHQDGVQKVLGYEPFMFLRCGFVLGRVDAGWLETRSGRLPASELS